MSLTKGWTTCHMHVKKKLDMCVYPEMPEPNSLGCFLDISLFLTKTSL